MRRACSNGSTSGCTGGGSGDTDSNCTPAFGCAFKALKEIKFPADGDLALEYESNPANPVEDMKQCLVVAREAIAKV